MACETCGGNCGQCGTSVDMGKPPSLKKIIGAFEVERRAEWRRQRIRAFIRVFIIIIAVIGVNAAFIWGASR